MPDTKKIDVLRATHIALNYFRRIYKASFLRIRIEEIELTKDEKYWLLTIGYDIPGTSGVSFAETLTGMKPMPLREYKEFKLDAITGEVMYMRIRKI